MFLIEKKYRYLREKKDEKADLLKDIKRTFWYSIYEGKDPFKKLQEYKNWTEYDFLNELELDKSLYEKEEIQDYEAATLFFYTLNKINHVLEEEIYQQLKNKSNSIPIYEENKYFQVYLKRELTKEEKEWQTNAGYNNEFDILEKLGCVFESKKLREIYGCTQKGRMSILEKYEDELIDFENFSQVKNLYFNLHVEIFDNVNKKKLDANEKLKINVKLNDFVSKKNSKTKPLKTDYNLYLFGFHFGYDRIHWSSKNPWFNYVGNDISNISKFSEFGEINHPGITSFCSIFKFFLKKSTFKYYNGKVLEYFSKVNGFYQDIPWIFKFAENIGIKLPNGLECIVKWMQKKNKRY